MLYPNLKYQVFCPITLPKNGQNVFWYKKDQRGPFKLQLIKNNNDAAEASNEWYLANFSNLLIRVKMNRKNLGKTLKSIDVHCTD